VRAGRLSVRVMFITYLVFIAAGLAYAIAIGLLHQ
jgi:hypothetical protein